MGASGRSPPHHVNHPVAFDPLTRPKMNVPENISYTQTHEWIRVEGDLAVVGITDHAQQELTDIVYVELPEVGTTLHATNQAAVVESVKAASDIYTPVGGEIVEVNADLVYSPGLINEDPYGRGWIFKIRMSAPEEVQSLKPAGEYAAQLGD